MKNFKIILLALSLLSYFSCDLFRSDQPVNAGNGSLTSKVFPPEVPYKPKPILVTGISSSNDTYANKIIIEWKTEEKGVYYTRLFWFENFNDGSAEYEKTLAHFYEEDNLEGRKNYTQKLSRSTGSYEHMNLNNDPNEDQPLLPGKRYFYLIKFYDGANRVVGYSELFFGTTAKIPYDFIASRDIKQVDESSPANINLEWKWKGEHKGFRIYRKDYENHASSFSLIKTLTDLTEKASYSFVDSIPAENVGKEYVYYVVALLDNEGKESKPSGKVRGTTVSANAPDAPTLFRASKGLYGDLVYLSWQPVSDPEGKPITYKVYYKLITESLWEEVKNPVSESFYQFKPQLNQRYKKFYFYVVAVNEASASSGPSTTAAGTSYDSGYLIPYPQNFNLSLMQFTDKIELNWSKAIVEEGAINYKIYRSTSPTEENPSEIADISENHYEDTGVSEGVLYYYSIQPYNTDQDPVKGTPWGTKTPLSNSYGIAGNIPSPVIEVSENQPTITIDLKNKPDYCKTRLRVSRPRYKPVFVLKPGRTPEPGATTSKPVSYKGSFDYKCDPNRTYSSYELLKELPIDATRYTDTEAVCGKNRYEAIYTFTADEVGLTLTSQTPAIALNGYRKISDEEFCLEALQTVNKSQYHLTRIHKTGTSAAGFDSIALRIDSYSAPCKSPCSGGCENKILFPDSGCFHYNAVVSLGSGKVTVPLVYNDYQPYDMIFNSVGTGHQTVVNLSSNGDLTGYINVSGIYSGKLEFKLKIEKGVKNGGTYQVTQTGGSETELSWDIDKIEIESYLSTL